MAAGYILTSSHRIHRDVIYIVAIVTLIASPVSRYVFRAFIPNPLHASVAPASAVQAPDILSKPTEKKNLIIIYLESVERSYLDLAPTKMHFVHWRSLSGRGWP
ncbi:MAG: hypothetical protein R3D78_08805 [Paracoccaceae bacterium]